MELPRKLVNSFLKRNQNNKKENKLDIWLLRFSQISQIILVFVAIFGFFYVALPVYQNQWLSEQVAKKELELIGLNHRVDSMKFLIGNLQSEYRSQNDSFKVVLDSAKINIDSLSTKNYSLSEFNMELKNKVQVNQKTLDSVHNNVIIEYKNAYLSKVYSKVFSMLHKERNAEYEQDPNGKYTLRFRCSKPEYLDKYSPYYIVKDAIQSVTESDIKSIGVPSALYRKFREELTKFYDNNKERLITNYNFDELKKDYENEVMKLDTAKSEYDANKIINKYERQTAILKINLKFSNMMTDLFMKDSDLIKYLFLETDKRLNVIIYVGEDILGK